MIFIRPAPRWLLVMAIVVTSCVGVSDEQQIKNLLLRSTKAWNEKEYHTLYKMQTPNYRRKISYEEYRDFIRGTSALMLLFLGGGKIKISDIKVRVKGQWGYASYKIKKDGEVLYSVDEDIFLKVKGRWYDVVDDPMTPGYNKEDLPPEKRFGLKETREDVSEKPLPRRKAYSVNLYIQSNVDGAEVYLNGEMKAVTRSSDLKASIFGLRPGKYEIRIKKAGYKDAVETIELRDDKSVVSYSIELSKENEP